MSSKNAAFTTDQQQALACFESLMRGPDRIFILKGYAGTGKTFLLNEITRILEQRGIPFVLMAPTGRAAKILRQQTSRQTSTIHRGIYQMNDVKEINPEKVDNAESYKFFFDLARKRDEQNCVYIIDEASMVSDEYSEGEFFRFGSGHLLSDLMTHTAIYENGHQRKIIFCGDPAQLPPVNEPESPALQAATFHRDGQANPIELELRQVVRQQQSSGILQAATWLREHIAQKDFSSFEVNSAPDITFLTTMELLGHYLDSLKNHGFSHTILIASTNANVKLLNNMVRESIFGETAPSLRAGDRLMIARNNYRCDIPVFNGDFATVISASPDVETHVVPVNQPVRGKRHTEHVKLEFRQVDLQMDNPEHGSVTTRYLINETLLNSTEAQPTSLQNKALYVFFRQRHRHLGEKSPLLKKALVDDPYFNCLHVKYGYAITGHKAQGGEWEQVYIDMQPVATPFHSDYFRWAYTAITRCRGHLFLLNCPRFSILKSRKAIQVPENIQAVIDQNRLAIPAPSTTVTDTPPFEFPEEPAFLKPLYLVLEQFFAHRQIRITYIRHRPYAEFYAFKIPDAPTPAVLTLHYKADGRISSTALRPNDSAPYREIAAAIDQQFRDKRLFTAGSAPCQIVNDKATGTTPESHMEYQPRTTAVETATANASAAAPSPAASHPSETFIETLRTALQSHGLAIRQTDRKSEYHLVCQIANETDHCRINYYFNSRGALTNALPDIHHSTSEELIRTVLKLNA